MGGGGGTGSTTGLGGGGVASASKASSGFASSTVEELDELVLVLILFDLVTGESAGLSATGLL